MSSDIDDTPRERLASEIKTPYDSEGDTWSALLDAIASELDAIETARAEVRASKFVDTADEASLARLADLFELTRRNTESVAEFRARVKVALRSQLASGTLAELREVATVLLDISRDELTLEEPSDQTAFVDARLPAGSVGASDVRPLALEDTLKTTTAAGVGVNATLEAELATVGIALGGTDISEMFVAPTLGITVGAGDTEATTINNTDTFGVDRFDGEGSFS